MLPSDELYLRDIAECCVAVSNHLVGATKQRFLNERALYQAIIREIEITGEATKRLSQELRAMHPDVPWHEVAGTRDILIHAYRDVDLDLVWTIATQDIPDLLAAVLAILDAA